MGKIKGWVWWADYIESSIQYRGGKLSYTDCSQYTYTRYSAHAFPIAGPTPSTTRDREITDNTPSSSSQTPRDLLQCCFSSYCSCWLVCWYVVLYYRGAVV